MMDSPSLRSTVAHADADIEAGRHLLPGRRGDALLNSMRSDFIGLDTCYTTADGQRRKRRFMDSAASTLMLGAAERVTGACLRHYANTHSFAHFSARISTGLYHWAHERVLRFLQADAREYTCIFTGSGSTAGLNRLARLFRDRDVRRDTVLVSLMEHHSNDLPHRRHGGQVVSIPCEGEGVTLGPLDLNALQEALERHAGRVRYLAVTAASNVTGIINPIARIARLAHAHSVPIVVDGSQIAAHMGVNVGSNADPRDNMDAFVFSGHKVYAPGSPGAIIVRRDLLSQGDPAEFGGGMVDHVWLEGYQVSQRLPDREEAGTPNIPGAVRLASAIEVLDRIGMSTIYEHECALTRRLYAALQAVPGLRIYGTLAQELPRTPTAVFNIEGIEHGLLAAILNDYFNIAVRNECFCAQPYVREMLREELWDLDVGGDLSLDALVAARLGMVRVSLGLYSTAEDIDALGQALTRIAEQRQHYCAHYVRDKHSGWRHRSFYPSSAQLLDPVDLLDAELAKPIRGHNTPTSNR